jgi:hypothetical protein
MRSIGYASSSNDWNSLGNSYPNTVEQIDPSNFSGTSNGPTAASYQYGLVLNLSAQSSAQAQIYISHAGNDLIFRGGWNGSSWQTWNKVLTNQNYGSYALPLSGGTVTGTASFTSVTYPIFAYGNGNTAAVSATGLQVYSISGNGATMAFHRGGYYAVNMGLDSDNVIRIGGWSAPANLLQMDMAGNLTMANNVTAYSDETLKKDWADLPVDFVARLSRVKSGTYTRIDNELRQVGVGAQSLRPLMEEAIYENADGILSVAYGNAAMASAVELAKEVVDLKARIDTLEALVLNLTGK